jgi:hypothetical protein
MGNMDEVIKVIWSSEKGSEHHGGELKTVNKRMGQFPTPI